MDTYKLDIITSVIFDKMECKILDENLTYTDEMIKLLIALFEENEAHLKNLNSKDKNYVINRLIEMIQELF